MQRVGQWLVLAICVQGAIGYTQYFTGVPVLLVGIHVAGAVCVWDATVALATSMKTSARDGVEKLEGGVDEAEVLGGGEVVGTGQGHQFSASGRASTSGWPEPTKSRSPTTTSTGQETDASRSAVIGVRVERGRTSQPRSGHCQGRTRTARTPAT